MLRQGLSLVIIARGAFMKGTLPTCPTVGLCPLLPREGALGLSWGAGLAQVRNVSGTLSHLV